MPKITNANAAFLGVLAANLNKQALTKVRGRAGRNTKEPNIQKQLHAAGQPRMNTPGIIGFPKGQKI